MLVPGIPSWMVEGNNAAAVRVECVGGDVLGVVATLAGVGEVVEARSASLGPGQDVFGGKRGRRKEIGAEAVFASAAGPAGHGLLLPRGRSAFSQERGPSCPRRSRQPPVASGGARRSEPGI